MYSRVAKMKVFLGGTCNNSKWREYVKKNCNLECYDPVITGREWSEQDRQNEIDARSTAQFVVYVITPLMTGVLSISEVTDDSNKRPEKTVFCVLPDDYDEKTGVTVHFERGQQMSLEAVKNLVKNNGATIVDNLVQLVDFLNKQHKPASLNW